MFFTFDQSNPGGRFIINRDKGISNYVIIEADTVKEAEVKAEVIGIYFDGVEKGIDCSCCNDRWSRLTYSFDSDRTEQPTVYGEHVLIKELECHPFSKNKEPELFIHWKNGQVTPHWTR